MEDDPMRVCGLLVGLGEVEVLGVDDEGDEPVGVHVRCRALRPPCGLCGWLLLASGLWCWWTCRRRAGRCGWCGTNAAGDARSGVVVQGLWPSRTAGSLLARRG
ncbi:MAG: hypothetical protein OXH61_11605 [Acidimicrobiaceae bacterium]|nr:hypothetical protein [Acidimicrobiaceae bacterium]